MCAASSWENIVLWRDGREGLLRLVFSSVLDLPVKLAYRISVQLRRLLSA